MLTFNKQTLKSNTIPSCIFQGRGSLLIFFVSVLTFMTLVGGFSPLLEEMKVNILSFIAR